MSKFKKGGKKEEETPAAEVLADGRVVSQPGDGSCLFHSLSFGLGRGDATMLRREVADHVATHPNETISGTPIKDWVLWDTGLGVKDYACRMGAGSQWGGAIEMAVCSMIKGVDINVYEASGGKRYRRISAFVGAGSGTHDQINVVYSGRVHYDALEVSRTTLVPKDTSGYEIKR